MKGLLSCTVAQAVKVYVEKKKESLSLRILRKIEN